MNQEILTYLPTQRVGVLAVEMLDGSPHAATVHFAHTEEPFILYFETYRPYRKAEPLYGRPITRASFVVSSDEKNMKTLQLDGTIKLLQPNELPIFATVYLGKFPEKQKKVEDEKFVRFKFTPTWWRFTDWTTPQGKIILTSD
jgi:hypothetical protein